MKTIRSNQYGFVHLALIVTLVLLVVVGFAGYRLIQNNNKTTADSASTEKTVPSKIESKDDVQAASKALDSDQQDSAMDPSQLDSDLNDLL